MRSLVLVLSLLAISHPASAASDGSSVGDEIDIIPYMITATADYASLVRITAGAKIVGGMSIVALDQKCPTDERVYMTADSATAKFIVCMGSTKVIAP